MTGARPTRDHTYDPEPAAYWQAIDATCPACGTVDALRVREERSDWNGGDVIVCESCEAVYDPRTLHEHQDEVADAAREADDEADAPEANVIVRLPAYAAPVLDEHIDVTVPAAWAERVTALGAYTCYGPTYRRAVVEHLRDVSRLVRQGYSVVAYDRLLDAERVVGIEVRPWA